MKERTVTVTGKDLTIEDIVAVSRQNAEVKISADSKKKNQRFKKDCRRYRKKR